MSAEKRKREEDGTDSAEKRKREEDEDEEAPDDESVEFLSDDEDDEVEVDEDEETVHCGDLVYVVIHGREVSTRPLADVCLTLSRELPPERKVLALVFCFFPWTARVGVGVPRCNMRESASTRGQSMR